MIVLVMAGTITMLNLFVAVVISGYEKLNYESQKQELINMAQYSILVEKLLPDFLLRIVMKNQF